MTPRQRGTLIVVCLATAMLMLDIAVVNTALGRIAQDLDSGLTGVQWIVDAYALALAAFVLSAGSMADRMGRRRMFLAGLAAFVASSVACTLAATITQLDVFRAIQGIAAAFMFAPSLAVLADAFPPGKSRAAALAAYGAVTGGAYGIAPLIGGALTSAFGWRSIFLVNVPLGVLAIVGTLVWVRESRDPHARRLDWPGQVTLTAALSLLVLALLRSNVVGWSSTQVVLELAGAAVALTAFVVIQRRVATPMLPLGLFRNHIFAGTQVATLALSASFLAVLLYLTLYLQAILGLSALETGLVYLPATILLFLVAGATLPLARYLSPRAFVVGGLVLVGAGMLLMTRIGAQTSWVALLPGELVAAVGAGLLTPTVTALTLASVSEHQSGLGAGVNDTFRNAGIAVGIAVLGTLLPADPSLQQAPEAYVTGLHRALLVGAGIAAVGAVASVPLLKRARHPQQEHAPMVTSEVPA